MPANFRGLPLAGSELGYVENTNVTTLGASTVPIDLNGGCQLNVKYAVGQGPLYITFGGVVHHTTAAQIPLLILLEDGVIIGQNLGESALANELVHVERTKRRVPPPGLHVYKLQLGQLTATASANADGNVANEPISLTIIQG